MKKLYGRPIIVTLVASAVAINGIASLMKAIIGVEFTTIGLLEAFLSAVVGLALVHRAYGLWNLRQRAWQITLILLCLRTVLVVFRFLDDPSSAVAGINLILVVITILYLVQPSVREAFSGRQASE